VIVPTFTGSGAGTVIHAPTAVSTVPSVGGSGEGEPLPLALYEVGHGKNWQALLVSLTHQT